MTLTVARPLGPQALKVLDLLRRRGNAGVTALDALTAVGSFRLGARIWELKQAGYEIETVLVTTSTGKRIGSYRLHERPAPLTGEQIGAFG